MFKLYCLFAAAMVGMSLNAAAAGSALGPILVGQGGGESEYSVVFARQNLTALLTQCLTFDCDLLDSEKTVLRELVRRARKQTPVASFKDSKELGGYLFRVGAGYKTVDINQDLLWLDDQGQQAYDVPAAARLWIQILAQLAPSLPPAQVARIQAQLAPQISRTLIKAQISFKGDNNFEALIFKQSLKTDRLYLRDSAFNSTDFTPVIRGAELCFAAAASDLQFSSVRWAWVNPNDVGLRLGLELIMNWKCADGNHRGRAKLVVNAKPGRKFFEIDTTSSEVYLEGE